MLFVLALLIMPYYELTVSCQSLFPQEALLIIQLLLPGIPHHLLPLITPKEILKWLKYFEVQVTYRTIHLESWIWQIHLVPYAARMKSVKNTTNDKWTLKVILEKPKSRHSGVSKDIDYLQKMLVPILFHLWRPVLNEKCWVSSLHQD
jgi:hypothetical protein